jgi:hypothetical protein
LADLAAPERCWTGLMIRRSRRWGTDSPPVPPVPGALGLPAVPVGRPARRRGAQLARTLRTRWWPRFLLLGVVLVIVAATAVSGAAAAWLGLSGAAIITVAVFRAASMTPADYRREPPIPPGGLSGP